MTLHSETHDGHCQVQIAGELTIYSATAIKSDLAALLDGAELLDLALADVSEFDSAGVQVLLWLKREMAERGRPMRISSASPSVLDVLHLLGLADDVGYAVPSPV